MGRTSLAPALLLLAACTATSDRHVSSVTSGAAVVRPGIETFLAGVPAPLRGKRVALITNQSGIDRAGVPVIDLIARHKDLKLVALLAPEHGIRELAEAGERIDDGIDDRTGVPIYSLYKAEDRGPTAEMLEGVDVLVYDLQEVGGRTWTYVSTMALAMQARRAKASLSSCSTAPIRSAARSSKAHCSIHDSSRSSACTRSRHATA
ncbi:MAG TPA: exo-beta-N-acetylmuramidase NamZ domain-containing protein [Thermoanaerobaculia bacterium]|nr:exo-beta-N-acetylmuramidase NamZ domain-containing protein [Thermoanaerobaculia bacterium]